MDASFTYPSYKSIDIGDKELFSKLTGKYPSYSDFNLLSLLSWNKDNTNLFSVLNGNLVLKIKDYLGDSFMYSMLGESQIDGSLETLFKETDKLSFVPEITVKSIKDKEKFIIEPDRDNSDYIISLEKVAKMDGREFRHMRADVHLFQRKYPDYETRQFELKDTELIDKIVALTEKWCRDKNFSDDETNEELSRLKNFFQYAPNFHCTYSGIFIKDKMIAYMVNEVLSDKILMGDFGVADKEFEASTPMMEFEIARHFITKGFTHHNIQQDTGLQGLRASKLFYNPEYFLEKFVISKK